MALTNRVRIVCGACGSDSVMRDAWAEWNTENQAWELGQVFDAGHCDNCDGEARLVERPVRPVYEVTAFGFFAGSDLTDDRVLWVEADDPEQVGQAIAGLKAQVCKDCVPCPELEDLNFTLPAEAESLRARLQHFIDTPIDED